MIASVSSAARDSRRLCTCSRCEVGGEVGRGAQRVAIAPALEAHAALAVVERQLVEQLAGVQAARQMRLDGRRLERLLGGEQQRLDDALAQLPAHRLRRMKIGPNGAAWLSSITPSRASSRQAPRCAAIAERRSRSSPRPRGR